MSILNNDNYGVSVQNFIGSRNPNFNGKITSVPTDLPVGLNFIKIDQEIYVEYESVNVSYDNNNPQYATTRVGVGSGENFKLLIDNKIITIDNVSSINIQPDLAGYHYIIINKNIYIRFIQRGFIQRF